MKFYGFILKEKSHRIGKDTKKATASIKQHGQSTDTKAPRWP